MRARIAVNGYGTIGKRVADAVARQPDLELVGVAKTRPSFEAQTAQARGIPIFVADGANVDPFRSAGIPVAGRTSDLLNAADLVVDCAPEKIGKENAVKYKEAGKPAIFQGGEKAEVAEVSFNALANFDAARGRQRVRVVSCNTTGLARAASVLRSAYGVEEWEATMVRRAGDPAETDRGPIDGILPTFPIPSHHGADVRSIFPDLTIATAAVVVPTTLMHVHVNRVRLARPPATVAEVLDRFRATPRFHIFRAWEHVDGTPQVMEYGRDRSPSGRPDVMENVLWEQGIRLEGRDLHFFQAIHQESIVVPENIDAIRAMLGLAPDAATSIARTDEALGIPRPAK